MESEKKKVKSSLPDNIKYIICLTVSKKSALLESQERETQVSEIRPTLIKEAGNMYYCF